MQRCIKVKDIHFSSQRLECAEASVQAVCLNCEEEVEGNGTHPGHHPATAGVYQDIPLVLRASVCF